MSALSRLFGEDIYKNCSLYQNIWEIRDELNAVNNYIAAIFPQTVASWRPLEALFLAIMPTLPIPDLTATAVEPKPRGDGAVIPS